MNLKEKITNFGKSIRHSRYQPFGLYGMKKEKMRNDIIDYLTEPNEADMERNDAEYVADNALKFFKTKNTAEAETSSMMIKNGATVDEAKRYSAGVKDQIAKKTAVADAVGLGVVEVGGIIVGVYLLKEGTDFISDKIHAYGLLYDTKANGADTIINNAGNTIINNATNVQITQAVDTSMYNLDMTLEELSKIIGTDVPTDTAINTAFEYDGQQIIAIGSDSIPLHAAMDDTNPLMLDKLYDVLRTTAETSDVYVVGGDNPAIYAVVDGNPVWSEKITQELFNKIYESYEISGSTDYELVKSGTVEVNNLS